MTTKQQKEIILLQREGKGYRTIAAELDLPVNSVKSWCKRHSIENEPNTICLQCGAEINQTPGKRERKFCSDNCRSLWWSAHRENRSGKASYHHICRFCGKEFVNERITASYCNRLCFAKARMKAANDE